MIGFGEYNLTTSRKPAWYVGFISIKPNVDSNTASKTFLTEVQHSPQGYKVSTLQSHISCFLGLFSVLNTGINYGY